ncbi:MAG: MFS transporter [Caulobacteraceae bacterium]
MSEGQSRPGLFGRGRPAALGFVYAAILLNVTSMGVIIPVFPSLLKGITHTDDAHAAVISGFFAATWSLMQLIFAPWFGAISDRFGRRPVLLVSMFGLDFDYVIMALAPNLAWLFIGRVIAGITAASGSAAGAYVADVSTPENRARNFGRFMAAANAGIVLGPALGGLAGHFDPRAPFWLAAALSFANGVFGLLVVPESLAPEKRAPFKWASANAFGSLKLLFSYKGLAGLSAVIFINQFAAMSFNSIFNFYMSYRFGWKALEMGAFLMGLGGVNVLVQSQLSGRAADRLGDRGAVLAGLACACVALVVMGLSPWMAGFVFGTALLSFSGVAGPAVQSLMTQRVDETEQGRLQGAMSIFLGLTGLVAPICFTQIFSWSTEGAGRALGQPGLSMICGAALLVVAIGAAYIFARPAPRQGHD